MSRLARTAATGGSPTTAAATGTAPDTRLAIRLGPESDPQTVGYSFVVGDTANALAPSAVTLSGIGIRSTFVNTSFHLLNGFDYLFDADGGWVGFRPKR
jgi:hypothetical protein